MGSAPNSLILISGSLWSGVAVPVEEPSKSQIELFNHLQMIINNSNMKLYSYVQIIYIP